jgi:hypothetical protein
MLTVGAAGFAAGGVHAVVRSGTLVPSPAPLAVGLPPVTASIGNSIGLVVRQLTAENVERIIPVLIAIAALMPR